MRLVNRFNSGTTDVEAIKKQIEKDEAAKEEEEEKGGATLDVLVSKASPSPLPHLESTFTDPLSSMLDSSVASSTSSTSNIKTFQNKSTDMEIEV